MYFTPNCMKKIIFIGIALIFLGSCSIDDDNINSDFYFEYVPIEAVDMPDSFELGESYSIEYTYYRPTECHVFNDLYYENNLDTRTIAVINIVYPNASPPCTALTNELVTRTFNFFVNNNETYNFRFWQGLDESGADLYLEFEVPVNQ